MAWESRKGRGRYYTRTKRGGGRIVREYVGTGEAAELIAKFDEARRSYRHDLAQADRKRRGASEAAEAGVVEFCKVADLLARVALLATGHHQHHRGEWRRKREPTK